MRTMLEQATWAQDTQSRRLNAVCTSPLNFRPRLWLTFQPVPKEDRSVLIGVGYALVCTPPPVLKSRGNRDQIAARAQRAAPVGGTVFVLERGALIIHPLGDVGRGLVSLVKECRARHGRLQPTLPPLRSGNAADAHRWTNVADEEHSPAAEESQRVSAHGRRALAACG